MLGAGPRGGGDQWGGGGGFDRFQQQQQPQQFRRKEGHTTWHSGKPQKDQSFSSSRTENSKLNKNYLPKIKVEGCKPRYFPEEFGGLSSGYLECRLCNKKPMWDGESFVRHLLGNAHNKEVETAIEADVERVKKLREVIAEFYKKSGEGGGSRCGMCDTSVGDIIKHRKQDFHQNMKQFIHPHCEVCDADFEDRTDWYYHRYSAYHLQHLQRGNQNPDYSPTTGNQIDKLIERLTGTGGGKKGGKNSSAEAKKSTAARPKFTKKENGKKVDIVDDDEVMILDDDNNCCSSDGKEKTSLEAMNVIGAEYIKPVNGLFCKLCSHFFMSDEAAILQHCSSSQHVDSVQMIEKQTGIKRKSGADDGPLNKK